MTFNADKYCSDSCQDSNSPTGICDFCHYYDFNGDEIGAYTGDGYCNFLKEPSEPYYGCEQFICTNVKSRSERNS